MHKPSETQINIQRDKTISHCMQFESFFVCTCYNDIYLTHPVYTVIKHILSGFTMPLCNYCTLLTCSISLPCPCVCRSIIASSITAVESVVTGITTAEIVCRQVLFFSTQTIPRNNTYYKLKPWMYARLNVNITIVVCLVSTYADLCYFQYRHSRSVLESDQ